MSVDSVQSNKLCTINKDLVVPNEQNIINVREDGNCLFRAICKCILGTEDKHDILRSIICDHMEKQGLLYSEEHIAEMRKDKVWGTEAEIMAASNLFNITIEVFNIKMGKWFSFQNRLSEITAQPCIGSIYLVFNNNHFDSVNQNL